VATGRKRSAASRRPNRLLLRIELDELTPIVWRSVWVDESILLVELHHIIQAAMGWTDAHLHEFTIGQATYATPDPDDEPTDRRIVDERTTALTAVLAPGIRFEYLYDFGDSWLHRLHVERALAVDEPVGYGFIERGERACPPEDCGGTGGYQVFLDALASDPTSDDVTEFLAWTGTDFDPDRFDRHAANAAMLRMAWNQWGKE
jgi:hypothetical protein